MKCEDCIEWEYFEGYGYGCFCMKTMTPIDANKCEFYADKRPDNATVCDSMRQYAT